MRFVCFLFLLAFAGAVAAFAYLNNQDLELHFLSWNGTYPVSAVVGAAYGLGMLSGWSIIGILRRSLRRVTEDGRQY